MHLKAQFTSQTSFPKGSKVVFECSTGHVVGGEGTMTVDCLGEHWTPLRARCQRVSCGPPGDVMNGWYDIGEGLEFGNVARAHCDSGYILVGISQRTCMQQGWSGREAVCEPIDCGPAPEITYGAAVSELEESYSYGAVIWYRCNPGLTLIGSPAIHCDKTGQFIPDPPKCIDVTCPTPVIENANRIEGTYPPYTYPSYVRFECRRGYKMFGSPSLNCQIDGRWSEVYPWCEEVYVEPEKKDLSTWEELKNWLRG